MSRNDTPGKRPGFLRRIINAIRSPSTVYSLGGLMITGFAAGIVFWGGFNWAMEETNNQEFCISCHEMRVNVYAEYKGSVHEANASGVRATCPDCHVPKAWAPKVVRKIQASWELYGHFVTGIIDTPEKFEAHRLDMASSVWAAMKKTDSRECRNCHKFDYMDFTEQENRAADNHQIAQDEGKTCIDCHQGIAHRLPEGYLERYRDVVAELEAKGLVPEPKGVRVSQADAGSIRDYLAKQD
ncbi:NapC/NirT family cytochrome c [Thalassococcus sp. CAU 1522]|uniref:NapC/NirT family cytochrome c n=1 Tax=Thalassococcus arenae TaxID=2851652 RepID=A0ABS6NA85_9RHOB|nr:NapC/NirT family cytochrome c [Thalassococcus arenae]MBV2360937.1 NapC/NirT family cytochrome c [Thalassococcus arenae]